MSLLRSIFGRPNRNLGNRTAASVQAGRLSTSAAKSSFDRYYELHDKIETAAKAWDLNQMARFAKDTTPLFNALVLETKRQYGSFDLSTSVAVHKGGHAMAALGDISGLEEMHRALSSIPELQPWAASITERLEDATLGQKVIESLKQQPGLRQTQLKAVLGVDDGRRISNLCYWMNKAGRIQRKKVGSTYEIIAR